jgi:hypothetical protein
MGAHCSGMAGPELREARIIGIVPKALCLAHGEGAAVTRRYFDKSQVKFQVKCQVIAC